MKPLWSILIPSVPSRIESACRTFKVLEGQKRRVYSEAVEILMLLDNKMRTVGMKRQALLEAARGDYVSFVDDDDVVTDGYVPRILTALTSRSEMPDVVSFPVHVTMSYASGRIDVGTVEMALDFPNEELKPLPKATLRKPTHLSVWKRSIALQAGFSDVMWGEDKYFMERACALAKTEYRIEAVLYEYRWSETGTEAGCGP